MKVTHRTDDLENIAQSSIYTRFIRHRSKDLIISILKRKNPETYVSGAFHEFWWRWRELNPRPPALRSRILHA